VCSIRSARWSLAEGRSISNWDALNPWPFSDLIRRISRPGGCVTGGPAEASDPFGDEQFFGTVTCQQPSHGGWVSVDQYPCCGEHPTWAMSVVWLT